jgi:hypothetical protein
MKRFFHHVIIPSIIPAAFSVVAATPVEVLGCRNRGLAAVTIAIIGGLAALGAALKGLAGRVRGDSLSAWWVASALVLSIPAVIIVVIA